MNRALICIYLIVGVCLCSQRVLGQQDPLFSHFMFTPVYNNPGFAGMDHQTKVTLLHRSQWLGYQATTDEGGAPATQLLSATHPLMMGGKDVKAGVGLFLTNDQLGPLKNFNLKASYSYHVDIKKTGAILGMGARVGFFHQRLDASLLRPSQEGDILIEQLQQNGGSQMRPDLGVGLWYNTTKYYLGVSMSHIFKSNFDYKTELINSVLTRHLFVNLGYMFDVSGTLKLVPTGMVKTDFAETSFDLGMIASINDYTYWGGVNFRQSISRPDEGRQLNVDDIVLIIGMGFLKRTDSESGKISKPLRVGYAFDLVTTGPAAKNPTSHEIFMSYVFPIKDKRNPPPLRTPRYRHEN